MNDWREKAGDAMKRRGMTVLQLARELGVTPTTVGRWFSGRRTPAAGTLRHIGAILGIRLASAETDREAGELQEIELLIAFRRMRPAERALLLRWLRDREQGYLGRPEDPDC